MKRHAIFLALRFTQLEVACLEFTKAIPLLGFFFTPIALISAVCFPFLIVLWIGLLIYQLAIVLMNFPDWSFVFSNMPDWVIIGLYVIFVPINMVFFFWLVRHYWTGLARFFGSHYEVDNFLKERRVRVENLKAKLLP